MHLNFQNNKTHPFIFVRCFVLLVEGREVQPLGIQLTIVGFQTAKHVGFFEQSQIEDKYSMRLLHE